MAEVQIVQIPQANPAVCVYCGGPPSDTKPWFLDTGLSYEEYGVVYFCSECSNFLMDKMGYMSIERANDLREANARLARAKTELELKVTALQQAINAMKVAGFEDDGSSDSSLNYGDSVPTPLSLPFVEVSVETVDSGQDELSRGEEGSSGSSDESGLADVPTNSEPNPFDFTY